MLENRNNDELTGLRRLLRKMEAGTIPLRQEGHGTSTGAIAVLRREIAHLEKVLANRRESEGGSAADLRSNVSLSTRTGSKLFLVLCTLASKGLGNLLISVG